MEHSLSMWRYASAVVMVLASIIAPEPPPVFRVYLPAVSRETNNVLVVFCDAVVVKECIPHGH